MKRIIAVVLVSMAVLGAASIKARESSAPSQCGAKDEMVYIAAGPVLLGEDGAGRNGRLLDVAGFWIDRHEVTNAQFAAFVAMTGYQTQAEREGGSAVFEQPDHLRGGLGNPSRWWRFVRGASWRHPAGPGTDIAGKARYPVVHVTFEDASAYARWAGRLLPDEVQWERAARIGQTGGRNPLSWAYAKDGTPIANSWQGVFPVRDTGEDRYRGIAPVGCFEPNAGGLYDMIGNVWEWTSSAGGDGATRLLKGGSYLCALNYCANFRAAAFQAQEQDLGASHIGFRTISFTPQRRRPAVQ